MQKFLFHLEKRPAPSGEKSKQVGGAWERYRKEPQKLEYCPKIRESDREQYRQNKVGRSER
jgi:hypothetical protein